MVNRSKSLIEKLKHLTYHYKNRSNELNRSVEAREAYALAAIELEHTISSIERIDTNDRCGAGGSGYTQYISELPCKNPSKNR